MVSHYPKRILNPLLDRADFRADGIDTDVPRAEYEKLSDNVLGQPSALFCGQVGPIRVGWRWPGSGNADC